MENQQEGKRVRQGRRTRKEKKQPGFGKYLLAFFALALGLLLIAYVQQNRENKLAIENLQQTSNSAMESVQDIMKENEKLKKSSESWEKAYHELNERHKELQEDNETMKGEALRNATVVLQMRRLYRLDRLYRAGRYEDARELLKEIEACSEKPEADSIFNEKLTEDENETTLYDRYLTIKEKLS